MPTTDRPKGPTSPSAKTVKRLFAVSGNRCAFPKCSTPLIDPQSGSVVGEMCHIKGEKPKAPRYDAKQSNTQRHGYDNLLLLCNVHHKIVDDDVESYTVERLTQMKQSHESRHTTPPSVDAATAKRFITAAIKNSTVYGSVISSHGQSGGQTAHSIANYYSTPSTEEPVRLEGKLDMAVDLDMRNAIGCAGMRLTVICRGSRPAKIKSAHLHIDGVDVMGGLQSGFGADFSYTPLEGSTQTLLVELIPLSPRNVHEGYVLNLDDVVRFVYPLPLPSTILALRAKPEDVSVVVQFFDDSEQPILAGDEVKSVLESLFHFCQKQPGDLNVPIRFGVKVKSTKPLGPESADLIGKVNPNEVPMVDLPASKPDEKDS